MDYKKLLGKRIFHNDNEILVESIKEVTDLQLGKTEYKINDGIMLNSFDVGVALNLLKTTKYQPKTFLQRIKSKYGLFKIKEENEDPNLLLSKSYYWKTYGFHKCSLSYEIVIFKNKYTFELVFSDKEKFESGEMYDYLVKPTKIF